MPRAQESMEGKILKYFRTAPPAAVVLLLGLVKDAVRERQQGSALGTRAATSAPRPASTANHHPKSAAKKAAKKKSHHKKKVNNAPPVETDAPMGELEDFGQIDS